MSSTTLIFDMYGVILEESKGNFVPYTFAHFPVSERERLIRQFRVEQLFTRAGNGEFTSDEFLSALGYADPAFHMRDYIEHHLTLDAGFVPFAEKYQGRYGFALLSNDVAQWSAYITAYHDLDRFFGLKVVSGDVQLRKPDPRIFELTLARLGKAAAECVFVDNSVANLRAAEALGMRTVLFNRDGEEYDGAIVNSFAELDAWLSQQ